jgi:hypothetical protein
MATKKKKPTVEQRLAALEAQVAAHKSALDIYPKLATWCDTVETDLKTLLENDRKLTEVAATHTHPFHVIGFFPFVPM